MKESVFINLGASNHSKQERQPEDYYATDPIAVKLLLEVEPQLNNIWECACGEGHLAKVFDSLGILGKATDLINRGYGSVEDFLLNNEPYKNGDIVMNPPYIKTPLKSKQYTLHTGDRILDKIKSGDFPKLYYSSETDYLFFEGDYLPVGYAEAALLFTIIFTIIGTLIWRKELNNDIRTM